MPLILIDIAYAILVTSLTGSVFLLIWLLAGCLLKKAGYLNIGNRLLRILPVFFMFPLSYVILHFMNERLWGGLLFLHTAKILLVAKIFLVVWCMGMAAVIIRYFWNRRNIKDMLNHATVCKMTTRGIFERVCRELHIPVNSVGLLESYVIPSAAVMGIRHPVVVIPCEKYTKEELNAIFYHELTHYLHKDVMFKHILSFVCAVNFFNPLIWFYRKVVAEWSEFVCDDCAQRAYGDVKAYAYALTAIAERAVRSQKMALGNSIDQGPMVRRIKNMLKYSKIEKKSKGLAAVVVAAAILLAGAGSTVVSAATADQYVNLYKATMVQVEEETVYEPGIEYVDTSSLEGVIVEEGEVIGNGNAKSSIISFSWTVSPGVLKKTPSLYCTAGQGIQVTCMFTPTTQDVRLGIIEPDGTRRFLQNNSTMSHTFALTKTGYYYVYVENISSTVTMTADGSYRSVD